MHLRAIYLLHLFVCSTALPMRATILLPCSGANCPDQIDQKATAAYNLDYQKLGALPAFNEFYCYPGPMFDGGCPLFRDSSTSGALRVSNKYGSTILSFTADPGALKLHAKLTSEDLSGVFQLGDSITRADLTVSQTYILQANRDADFKYVFSFDGSANPGANGAKPFWTIEAYVTGKFGRNLCDAYYDSSLDPSNASGSKTWSSSHPVACTGSISAGQTFLTTFIRFNGSAEAGSSLNFDNTIDFSLYVPDGVQVISASPDFPVYTLADAAVPEPASALSASAGLFVIFTFILRRKQCHR